MLPIGKDMDADDLEYFLLGLGNSIVKDKLLDPMFALFNW